VYHLFASMTSDQELFTLTYVATKSALDLHRWSTSSDLPLPWKRPYEMMRKRYMNGNGKIVGGDSGTPWEQRIDKAGFFGGHRGFLSQHGQVRRPICILCITQYSSIVVWCL
jgi:hypothetical protein